MSPLPYVKSTRPCQACGTWACSACGWQRIRAALDRPEKQDCARCGGTDGSFRPSRHSARTWEDHNPAAGPHCQAWREYNIRVLEECRHESCQVIAWGHVIRHDQRRIPA